MKLYVPLSVDFPDDPKVVEAGALAELVYVRALLRCRRYLTDGVINRVLVGRWFAGIAQPERHLGRLVDVGLLELHADGWCFPERVWREWNPTKAEVDERRAVEAERKRRSRARVRSASGDVPVGQVVAATGCPTTSKTETQTETETRTSSSREGHIPEPLKLDDDDKVMLAVAYEIGRLRAARQRATAPAAYAVRVATEVLELDRTQLCALIDEHHPAMTEREIAEHFEARPELWAPRLRLVGGH